MPEWFNQTFSPLIEYARRVGRRQLLLVGGGGLLALLLAGGLLHWATRPDWAVLYSGLSEVESARVIDELEAQTVPNRLTKGGTAIEVHRADLYRVRVKLAAKGGPVARTPGYDLLDKQRLGISDREMAMMEKRALEGELARTISELDWVTRATVHVVTPKPSLFSDEEIPVTASVTVITDPNRNVPRAEVEGVVALVASSVEGLHPGRVTVVDGAGRLLTEASTESEGAFGETNKQLELTRRKDNYLSKAAQDLLDQVLGKGHSVVRVSSELDFTVLEKTSRTFDPQNQVVRSQERQEESSSAQDTSQTAQENSVTNYEVNEILEHLKGEYGAIRRLSISLVVDGNYVPGGEGETTYVPRTPEEMQKLEQIVKTAVGFDDRRGDQIVAQNIAFDSTQEETENTLLRQLKTQDVWLDILRKVLFLAGILIFLSVLRSTLARINHTISQAFDEKRSLIMTEEGLEEPEAEVDDSTLLMDAEAGRSPEQRKRLKLHAKVVGYCKNHPEEAAKLVKAWLGN
ncbi:MAG: flagellar M-ring protein FliF [Candidatus Cloacimonetes bacterium]|nr:flagellar M-ring protein FliF [Candidatus Cloacimonadota bacterium]MCA9786403.1 flagellar M-ring protein FliF [Candidatus Cloacimonadota bacterium]